MGCSNERSKIELLDEADYARGTKPKTSLPPPRSRGTAARDGACARWRHARCVPRDDPALAYASALDELRANPRRWVVTGGARLVEVLRHDQENGSLNGWLRVRVRTLMKRRG